MVPVGGCVLVADLQDRLAVLSPHLHEGVSLAEAARWAGVPRRTATRWLAAFQAGGVQELRRSGRSDRGGRRLPEQMVELIEGLALRRPPPKVAEVHRAVNVVAVERGWPRVSYSVVRRIVIGLDRALLALATAAPRSTGMSSNWSCAEKRSVRTTSGRPTTPSSI
jgi:putative transposase